MRKISDYPMIKPKSTVIPTMFDHSLTDFGDSPIPGHWKANIRQKMSERINVFRLHEWDVGLVKGVPHHMRLSDTGEISQLVSANKKDVCRHLLELLKASVINELRSPYSAPNVVPRKYSRMVLCIDVRTLNRQTGPDQYTTLPADDALECLTGSRWSSV